MIALLLSLLSQNPPTVSEVIRSRLDAEDQATFDQYKYASVFAASGLEDSADLPPLIAELKKGSGHASIWVMNQTQIVLEILSSGVVNSRSVTMIDRDSGNLIAFRYADDFSNWHRNLRDEAAAVQKFLKEAPLAPGSYEPLDIGNRPDDPQPTWNYARIVNGWLGGHPYGVNVYVRPGVNVVLSAECPSFAAVPDLPHLPMDSTRAGNIVVQALLPGLDFPGWYRVYRRHFVYEPVANWQRGPSVPTLFGLATRQDSNELIQHAEYVKVDPQTGKTLINDGYAQVLGHRAPPQVRRWDGEAWRFRAVSGSIAPSVLKPEGEALRVQVWRTLEVVVADYYPASDLIVAEGVAGRPSPELSRAFVASQFGP